MTKKREETAKEKVLLTLMLPLVLVSLLSSVTVPAKKPNTVFSTVHLREINVSIISIKMNELMWLMKKVQY